MIDGVIKYTCQWERAEIVDARWIHELEYFRKQCMSKQWIGVGEDNIGFGNLSIRRDQGFLITGSQTGHLSDLGVGGYSLVSNWSLVSNQLTCMGLVKASSESLTHAALYDMDPSVGAVIHIHSAPIWTNWKRSILATVSDAQYGTPQMAKEIQRVFRLAASRSCAIRMAGHENGILAWGASLEEAYDSLCNCYGNPK